MADQALVEAPSDDTAIVKSTPPALPRFLYLLVAISGMSGLIYEIVWIRALGLHFGTSTPAVTTVVATFMAGLGLGNALLGRYADRVLKPLLLYRRIEFGLAASGLIVSLLVLRAGFLMDALSRLCAGLGPLALIGSALVLALLMVVPCTLMGGTLPVLSRTFVREGYSGRAVGALYVSNTLGALVGALLPDFVLIPNHGLAVTALVAAAGNALVALCFGFVTASSAASIPAPQAPDASRQIPRVPPAAWLLTAMSGFSGMAFEVLWSRTLAHWTTGLVTSFAVLLAVYLIMLAIGAAATRNWADRSRQPLQIAAVILVLSGLAALLPVLLAPWWHAWQHIIWPYPRGVMKAGILYQAIQALMHAAYLEGGACLLMGAAFPFVAAAMIREGAAGTATGRLFTVNTLAGTLGALLAGFLWLPLLGEQNSYLAAVGVLVCSTSLVMIPKRVGMLGRLVPVGLSLLLLLGCLIRLPKNHLVRTYFEGRRNIIALREGSTTTAAASQHMAYNQDSYLELLTPGVSMSNTALGARRYMGMMAHAAMLAAGKPERALLICYGTGNTASALVSYPELQRLDVVDISSEVLGLAPVFAKARGSNPLADPRVHVFVEDGRHYMVLHEERYNVITLEPPPPRDAGIVNLYSREFYHLAKSRLEPKGILTQWLPVEQLSEDNIRTMVSAFVAELPYTALIYGYNKNFILIGSGEPLSIDPREGLRRISAPTTAANLKRCGIDGLPDVYGAVIQTDSELRFLARNVPPLTDDRPSIQYPWAAIIHLPNYAAWFGSNPARAGALLADNVEAPQQRANSAVEQATERLLSVVNILQEASVERRELFVGSAIRLALAQRPNDEGLLGLLSLQSEQMRLAQQALDRPGARSLLEATTPKPTGGKQLEEYQAVRDAAFDLGRLAFYEGDYQKAFDLLSKLTPEPTKAASQALLLGGCLRALGRKAEAVTAFENARSLSHDEVFQAAARRLSAQVEQPFAPDAGPLALSNP